MTDSSMDPPRWLALVYSFHALTMPWNLNKSKISLAKQNINSVERSRKSDNGIS